MKMYVINNIAVISHLINTLTGGKHDHSFSSRVGEASMSGSKKYKCIESVIDNIFFMVIGQKRHCYNEYLRFAKGVKF
jgi:hypothetical protein